MLTSWRTAAAAVLALSVTAVTAASARADNPGGEAGSHCGPFFCEVEVDVPGSGGSGGTPDQGGTSGGNGGGGTRPATEPVCTYKRLAPQPPAGSLDWEGHDPSDGAVYEERCTYNSGLTEFTNVRNIWAATPPAAVTVDPVTLARQAVDQMLLRGPQIGITPKPGGKGVVGMPVYLWTERGPETYGPNIASASAGGITVTATAQVSRIVWNMGDGKSVICTTPGTPYRAEYGKKPSPDCGHRYTAPSSTTGTGTYRVNATSTWTIGWQATTGQSGQLTQTRQSAVNVTVAEVQVLN